MDEIKETLIFRTDRLGDFIISCPFIKSYINKFANNPVTIITSEYNSKFIEKFKFVSKTIPLENRFRLIPKIITLIKMIILLRQKSYRHIIILDGKKRSFFISLFLKGNKSALIQSPSIKFMSKILRYKTVTNSEIQHQVKNFSFLANLIGFKIIEKNPNIYENFHINKKFLFKKKFIILHLDEKWFSKLYYSDFTDINPSVDQIKYLIEQISINLNDNFDIVLTSGNRNIKNLTNFVSNFKTSDNIIFKSEINNKTITYLNNISIEDLAHVVSLSSLVICCEGAISHLSNNFNIPTLALYEKKRYQHTKFWTGHMKKISLYERKNINFLIRDNDFFLNIRNMINIK